MAYVRQRLNTSDEFNRPAGLDVRFMAVPLMWPSADVQRQRIESWKNEWRRRTDEIEGRAEAEAIRTREMARAQVQGEMTARINDALKEAQASGTGNDDLITLRFLEAMEKMAKDPTTRALLTLDSLKILQQLRQMLAPDQVRGQAMSARPRSRRQHLADWIVQHPRPIATPAADRFRAGNQPACDRRH